MCVSVCIFLCACARTINGAISKITFQYIVIHRLKGIRKYANLRKEEYAAKYSVKTLHMHEPLKFFKRNMQ